jgi:hypothetical protein
MARMALGVRRGGLTLLAVVAAVAGLVLIVAAVLGQKSAPQPPRSAGSVDSGRSASSVTSSGAPSAGPSVKAGPTPLGPSRPLRIAIPAVKVDSLVNPIGLADDGTLAVPQPGPLLDQAAWFKNSPTPGQPGPAIIEGHVDSDQGPSVFFELGKLRPGNKILVTRADGVRVTFTVNAVRDYQKSKFPTEVVYGSKNLGQPQLRLITCSDFDKSIRHHVGNEVVFAHLTSTHR